MCSSFFSYSSRLVLLNPLPYGSYGSSDKIVFTFEPSLHDRYVTYHGMSFLFVYTSMSMKMQNRQCASLFPLLLVMPRLSPSPLV